MITKQNGAHVIRHLLMCLKLISPCMEPQICVSELGWRRLRKWLILWLWITRCGQNSCKYKLQIIYSNQEANKTSWYYYKRLQLNSNLNSSRHLCNLSPPHSSAKCHGRKREVHIAIYNVCFIVTLCYVLVSLPIQMPNQGERNGTLFQDSRISVPFLQRPTEIWTALANLLNVNLGCQIVYITKTHCPQSYNYIHVVICV